MSSNLPPGVSVSDIPGNRPEDEAWEKLIDKILASGWSVEEAYRAWEIGHTILVTIKESHP